MYERVSNIWRYVGVLNRWVFWTCVMQQVELIIAAEWCVYSLSVQVKHQDIVFEMLSRCGSVALVGLLITRRGKGLPYVHVHQTFFHYSETISKTFNLLSVSCYYIWTFLKTWTFFPHMKLTNKYGRGTKWHLPKIDESVVRPTGERR